MNHRYQLLVDFLSLFEPDLGRIQAEAQAILARRGLYDLQISAGRIYARGEDGKGGFASLECSFPQLPEKKIQMFVEKIAHSAILFSHILEGRWSPEIEQLFADKNAWILPMSTQEIVFRASGKKKSFDVPFAALLFAAVERFESDPLQIFVLAGQGREELVTRVRHTRKQYIDAAADESERLLAVDLSPEVLFDENGFYQYSETLEENIYQLRADELPALILRRVDLPSLWGFEARFEQELSEVYNRIAIRAQAYILALAKERYNR